MREFVYPDIVMGPGDICPLDIVMTFAKPEHVDEMRNILLDAGATNTAQLQRRWLTRRAADAREPARLRRFYEDPR